MEDLSKAALELFAQQSVNREMISFLADAARNVLYPAAALKASSKNQRRATSFGMSPNPQDAQLAVESMPTLETFIAKLVTSSNVQVLTLMSTLVYVHRVKFKLQGKASGLPCTPFRIFLASLILAGKYLNDISPKNKHWAKHTVIKTDLYTFGFNRKEVNLMEKQLLCLLECDVQITEQDLYRELEFFLRPLRPSSSQPHTSKIYRCVVKSWPHIHALSHILRFSKPAIPLSPANGVSSQTQAA